MSKPDLGILGLRETPGLDGRQCRIHTVAFEDPHVALAAAKRLVADGYHIIDAHSPCPIHGIEEVLGWKETRVGYATLIGGLVGLTIAVSLQMFVHGYSWPLNIGGKTSFAWPAMGPVAFELTVLIAAFATLGTLLHRGRLRPTWNSQVSVGQPDPLVNDNRFVLLVLEKDGSFNSPDFRALCKELKTVQLREDWKVLS